VIRPWPYSSQKTLAYFRVRCIAIPVVVTRCGPQILVFKRVFNGDVEREFAGAKCFESRSIKLGSWFHRSNLTFQEIIFVTNDIVLTELAHQIQNEHRFGKHTVTDWGKFCRETLLVLKEGCSENITGPNMTIEIYEIKFDRRKYHRGHTAKSQCVFGGVERRSGTTFLISVPDRIAITLTAIILTTVPIYKTRDRLTCQILDQYHCWYPFQKF
jgi:hypothetical protein